METSFFDTSAPRAGRLEDPDSDLRADERTHPALLAALQPFGMDTLASAPAVTRDHPVEQVVNAVQEQHDGFEGFYQALPNDLPGDGSPIEPTLHTITTSTGDEIVLHLYRRSDTTHPTPCVVYIHGGGMSILATDNKVHRRWCSDIATTGLVVVAVDFRNAHTSTGRNPFPIGLEDCGVAVRWISSHKEELGITKVVLQGESGGANLALATALKAKQDGFLTSIDGVYATVPYISGGYAWDDERKMRELPSLVENDGYFLNCQAMDLLVHTYDPTGAHVENPLCWPYYANEEDMTGLPPHVISVDEVDPLRDEGIAYFRKLIRAGVPAVGRVNLGLVHAAESIFRQAVPDSYWFTVGDIHRFANHL